MAASLSGIKSDISTAYYALLDGKLRAAKRRQNKGQGMALSDRDGKCT